MTVRWRGVLLMAAQALLVLTVAAKYEWERHTRPAVWVRAEPFGFDADHMTTLSGEGRYGRLQLDVDACGLSTAHVEDEAEYGGSSHRVLRANVRTIARGGSLVAVDAGALRAADVQEVYWDLRRPCTEARLLETVNVYLPKNVREPYTVPPGATLWALVTVPKSGPLRPVELATSDAQGFHAWKRQ